MYRVEECTLHLSFQCLASLTFLHPAGHCDQEGLGEAIAEGPEGLTRVAGYKRVQGCCTGIAELFVAQDFLNDFRD